MSEEIEVFYKLLRLSGLTAVPFDGSKACDKVRNCLIYYFFPMGIQLTLVSSVVLAYLIRESLLLADFMATEYYYNYILVESTFVTNIILRFWLICNQNINLQILELCKRWIKSHCHATVHSKKMLAAFFVAALVYFANLLVLFYELWFNGVISVKLCLFWTLFTYCYVTTVLILCLWCAIVMAISNVFKSISKQLEDILLHADVMFPDTDIVLLQALVHTIGEIIQVVSKDVSKVYGISLLLCMVVTINESIWNFFQMMAPNLASNHLIEFLMSMWMLPILILLAIGLLNNNVQEEVILYYFSSTYQYGFKYVSLLVV